MTTIIARSAESVHWYNSNDGSPQYTVKSKDGSDRPTTLRDARKMNLVPSVTTILKVASNPGLDMWKNEQLLLSAMTLPRKSTETEKEFIARVIYDSKETGKIAAEKGTRIHESIEKWYLGNKNVDHIETAKAFEKSVSEHFNVPIPYKWKPETSFSSELGFGGKVDLHCCIDGNDNLGIVIDAKTKDFCKGNKVEGYSEHLMQLAAYRIGLKIPFARCANVFASRTNPGLIHVVEWSQEDLRKGWEMFLCLLRFWKLKNNF